VVYGRGIGFEEGINVVAKFIDNHTFNEIEQSASLERTLTAGNLTLFSVMSDDHILISTNGSNGVDIGHDM